MTEQDTHSIVVVGDMNPTIFHPLWFSREDVIPENEAEAAEVKVIHPDITAFSAGWFDLQVTRQRFMLKTKMEAYYEPLRDLVTSTFTSLSHAPIKALGVNFEIHRKVNDLEAFIDKFAPKGFWEDKELAPQFETLSVRLQKIDLPTQERYLKITIEPSALIKDGIFINFNHHIGLEYDASRSENPGHLLANILNEKWVSIKDEVSDITEKILH
jgi:hypothetical protein